ncbi:MAG: beta-galactosidase [Deltaproteobacteria bacterium]|nr:beta-galactosidase [Deltaproteobacteria bacterium]
MVHLSSIAPERWEPALLALAALGFDSVDIPLIWAEHALQTAELDFDSPRLSLKAMASAARAAKLPVRLRLGPRPVQHLEARGLPSWIVKDEGCLARNVRRGAMIEPQGLAIYPHPSLFSQQYRACVSAWIRGASLAIRQAFRPDELLAVVVGDGTTPFMRGDWISQDHRAPESERGAPEAKTLGGYLVDLATTARSVLGSEYSVELSTTSESDSSVFAALGETFSLHYCSPFSSAGARALWSSVHASTARAKLGAHVDVQCGSPVWGRPLRNRDAVETARCVLAAGAQSITVTMACAGAGWIGGLLDEHGVVRSACKRWHDLFGDVENVLPANRPEIAHPGARLEGLGFAPLARGWLARYDLLAHPEEAALASDSLVRSTEGYPLLQRAVGSGVLVQNDTDRVMQVSDSEGHWRAPREPLEPGKFCILQAK